MRIVRAGRVPDAAACARWRGARPNSPIDGPRPALRDDYARTSVQETLVRLRDRLFAYDIFPSWAMLAASDPPGPLRAGTTIVQRVQFGFLAIECAVRVVDVWELSNAAGFRYVTLEGHPECGVESFDVLRDRAGAVRVLIHARSRPGQWLTWLGFPVARAIQVGLTRAALTRLTRPASRPCSHDGRGGTLPESAGG